MSLPRDPRYDGRNFVGALGAIGLPVVVLGFITLMVVSPQWIFTVALPIAIVGFFAVLLGRFGWAIATGLYDDREDR